MSRNLTFNLPLIGALWWILMCCIRADYAATMFNGWDVSAAVRDDASLQATADSLKRGDWAILLFENGEPCSHRCKLEQAGWRVVAFLPRTAWLVQVQTPNKVTEWFNRSAFTNSSKSDTLVISVLPHWKVARPLWEARKMLAVSHPGDMASVVIYATHRSPELKAAIEASGASVTSEPMAPNKCRYGIHVQTHQLAGFLDAVSEISSVYSIQPGGGARLLNDNAAPIVQSGSAGGGRSLALRGLRGEGQVIAVLDTGLDFDSCYFTESDAGSPPLVLGTATGEPAPGRRKAIVYDLLYSGDWGADPDDFDNHGHGTAVAGNALGSQLAMPFSSFVQNGVAPAAQIIVQDAGFTGFDNCADLIALQCPVVDLTPFLDQAVAQGAHIHNNSWGDRENFFPQNTYTAPTADMDDAVWRHPEFVIVCAAGNNGGSGDDTVGSPSVGKNVISAAATQSPTAGGSAETIAGFSSRGWAADGRIKPDLTAPGQTISADGDGNIQTGNCDVALIQGTSMASPITAACAALVRQYFTQGWYPSGAPDPDNGFNPTAALIKAVLIGGAVDMTGVAGPPPNRTEGWGRVNLENALYFPGDARRLLVFDQRDYFSTTTQTAWTRRIMAGGDASAGLLKVTLVWSDYPASPAASVALVNDLDLVVSKPASQQVFHGNHFNPVSGLTEPGGATDMLNNVEMVVLPAETTGELEVRVELSLLVEGPQGFAVVVGGDVAEMNPSSATLWEVY